MDGIGNIGKGFEKGFGEVRISHSGVSEVGDEVVVGGCTGWIN
jgi:hypothetical protein